MNQFMEFLQEYGIIGLCILLVSFFGSFAIKYPLKKLAEKYALKNGCDKSVITVWFSFIPVIIAFIGAILHEWGKDGWGNAIVSDAFSWTHVMVETIAIGMTSIGMYDILCNVKKVISSNAVAKNADESSQAVQQAYQTLADSATTESDKKKAEKKLQKLQAKKNKIEQARLAQIEKLRAQLSAIEQATVVSDDATAGRSSDESNSMVSTH